MIIHITFFSLFISSLILTHGEGYNYCPAWCGWMMMDCQQQFGSMTSSAAIDPCLPYYYGGSQAVNQIPSPQNYWPYYNQQQQFYGNQIPSNPYFSSENYWKTLRDLQRANTWNFGGSGGVWPFYGEERRIGYGGFGSAMQYPGYFDLPLQCFRDTDCAGFSSHPNCVYSTSHGHKVCCSTWNCY